MSGDRGKDGLIRGQSSYRYLYHYIAYCGVEWGGLDAQASKADCEINVVLFLLLLLSYLCLRQVLLLVTVHVVFR
jgi:hypothetical protein